MKNLKKLASLLLALVMVLGLATTAFAADNTGSITIKDSTNVSVAGKTFNAYKILDVTTSTTTTKDADGKDVTTTNYAYTVPKALTDFYTDYFKMTDAEKKDVDGTVYNKLNVMQNNSDDLFAFAAAALAAAKKVATITPGTATGAEGAAAVTINNLPLGYYVVEDTADAKPVSALILDTVGNVDIKIKADKPSVDKNIDGDKDTDGSTTGKVDYNNAAIGDTVPYVVTSKVPDMTGYEKYYFVVNDTLSKGLTFDANSVAIKIGSKNLVKDTDYTVTSTKDNTTGETAVEIVFTNFIQYKDQKDAVITITYSATVNADAVIGVAGNPNKVTLTYSNNPNTKDDGDPDNPNKPTPDSPVGETPESETRTYVTEIELIKVDEDKNRLTGAEFEITGKRLNKVIVTKDVFTKAADGTYYLLKDGTYTTTAPTIADDETDNSDKYDSTTDKYTKTTTTETITTSEDVKSTATVGADGTLKFVGLAAGDYTITEIKAPAGYNLLKDPIKVTIGWNAPSGTSTDCTWTYKWNDDATAGTKNSIEVENKSGTELPSTGGMGTTLFYVLGAALTLGAAVILITKRRMNAR